jgi:hypothetical protein
MFWLDFRQCPPRDIGGNRVHSISADVDHSTLADFWSRSCWNFTLISANVVVLTSAEFFGVVFRLCLLSDIGGNRIHFTPLR